MDRKGSSIPQRLALLLLAVPLFWQHAAGQTKKPPPPRARPPPPPSYCSTEPVCCSPASNYDLYKQYADPSPCPVVDDKMCNCSSEVWKVGQWDINFPLSLAYSGDTGGPYIKAITSLETCCKACSAANTGTNTDGSKLQQCNYWQHYVPPAPVGGGCTPSACGYCIIYPPGYGPPSCKATNCSQPDSSKYNQPFWYSTVGKGCAGGHNDPHFVGGHGTRFDFNGAPDKSFCLITDPAFHVNMKMTGYYDKRTIGATLIKNGMAVRTWIKELGVLWMDPSAGRMHGLKVTARSGKSDQRDGGYLESMEVDGTVIPRLELGEQRSFDGGLTLQFVGYEKQGGGFFDVDVYHVSIDHLMTIEVKLRAAHPLLQTASDSMVHINVRFLHMAHSESTHGVLGQTFREGRNRRALDFTALSMLMRRDISADGEDGNGFLDGSPTDYETSHVLSPDCRFSAFHGSALSSLAS